jgi:hypothetical protein
MVLSILTAAGLAFAVLLFRCSPEHDEWDDSGTPDDCEAACDNLLELGCDGAEGSPGPDEEYGTPDDVPCADVCREIMTEGGITMHPACVAEAESCEAVEECFE